MRLPRNNARAGLTLIELIVVMALIVLIVALAYFALPNFQNRNSVTDGADRISSWLLIAKQRAKRDQIPTGVRLFPDSNNVVRELQYIQTPDHFNGGVIFSPNPNNLAMIQGNGVDFRGGYPDNRLWPVQNGDYLEIKGGGLVHQIIDVQTSQLTLKNPVPYPVQQPGTAEYRVIRLPRVLNGEAPLELADDIVIDLDTNSHFNNPLPRANQDGTVDLVFSPAGNLLDNTGGLNGYICLWVRDSSKDWDRFVNIRDGGDILIAIQKKTGFIASHPPDPNGANPYTFATDGRSSGL